MLWKVKPNYVEYDLYDGAIIISDSKEEAERIADIELRNEYTLGHGIMINRKLGQLNCWMLIKRKTALCLQVLMRVEYRLVLKGDECD